MSAARPLPPALRPVERAPLDADAVARMLAADGRPVTREEAAAVLVAARRLARVAVAVARGETCS